MSELHVSGTGNAVGDAELKHIGPKNTPLCKFTLAFNRRYKSGEEWKEEACFIDVQTFFKAEEIASQIIKGLPVGVYGYLRQNVWQGQNGKQTRFDVVATEVHPGTRTTGSNKVQPKIDESPKALVEEESNDELPF